jgi:hypothetical protein
MHRVGRAFASIGSIIVGAIALSSGIASAKQPAPPAPAPAPPPPAPTPPAPAPDTPAPAPDTPAPDAPAPDALPIAISGRVIDKLGRPIAKAIVSLEGSSATATTNRDGYFTYTAPVGATLVISSDRYGVALATVTGPILDDVVLLTDLATEEIEIADQAPTPATGAAQLDREELQRIPGTGGDVVRALTAMPGVVNVQIPVGYSGVVIRGASPQDSKVLIDEFEIPILFHPFGFRAIVPTESIQSLTFVPGGFDVAYGRSSSGIVLLETRPGSEKRSTQAELSLVDGGIIAQGPLGEKTRYMAALRRSVIDFALPVFIPDSVDLSLTTVPQYWDEQLRVDHEISSKWALSVSSVGTTDKFELFTTKDEDAGSKRFYSRTRFVRLTAAAKYHEGPWTASLALSGMVSDFLAEIGLYQRLDVKTSLVTPRVVVTRTESNAIGLKDVVWSAGTEAQVGYSTTDLAIPLERREGEPFPPYDPKDTSSRFKGSVWFPDFAAWTSVAANFDPRIRISGGVRADVFGRPRELAIQPRTEIAVQVLKPLKARFGAGAYRRPPEFQSEFLEKDLKSERSQQLTMGLEYTPIPGVRIQGSMYYTFRTALITHNADGSLGNSGRGESKGAEILAVATTGSLFAWLGYSYSNSVRVDKPGATPRLFDYDQPHSLNAALSWRKGRWQLGGRFSVYSGLPSTPVVGAEFDSDRNLHIPIPGAINSDRSPTHHQFDVRVDYGWKWGPVQMLAFLDVQNVYLNRTIVTYFYSYDYTQKAAFESLPLIPSIGLRGVL